MLFTGYLLCVFIWDCSWRRFSFCWSEAPMKSSTLIMKLKVKLHHLQLLLLCLHFEFFLFCLLCYWPSEKSRLLDKKISISTNFSTEPKKRSTQDATHLCSLSEKLSLLYSWVFLLTSASMSKSGSSYLCRRPTSPTLWLWDRSIKQRTTWFEFLMKRWCYSLARILWKRQTYFVGGYHTLRLATYFANSNIILFENN